MKVNKLIKNLIISILIIFSISVFSIVITTLKVSSDCRNVSEINMTSFGKQKIFLKIPVAYKSIKREKGTEFFQIGTEDKNYYRLEYNKGNNGIYISLFTSTLGGLGFMSFTYEIKNGLAKDKIFELIGNEAK